MFHLFDKIYVCPDFLIDEYKKRIIVSNSYHSNTIKQDGLLTKSYPSIEELLKEITWPDFLDIVSREDKFRIYADVNSLAVIYINWLKTIFPDITKELAYKFYNTAVQRLKIHFAGATISSNFLKYHKHELMSVKFMPRAEFYQNFDSSTPWTDDTLRRQWVLANQEKFSIEWHIAAYFNDKSHLDIFRDKYLYVLAKAIGMEVSEWYFYIIKYFMQPGVKKEMNISVSWDDEDWRGALKEHQDLAWMFDDDLKYVTRDSTYLLTHVEEALTLGKKLQSFWFKDIKVDDKNRLLDEDYFESNHADFVFKTLNRLMKNQDQLTNEEIDEIIRDDVEAENVSIVFDILTHVIKCNPYQLQLIYELKNTNSPELSQLTFK
jgi:hypothetical protein